MSELLHNISLVSAVLAWFLSQGLKLLGRFRRTRQIDFRILASTGGMPSAHSALVAALATSVGLRTGLGSPQFAVALLFAVIVMFDAQSVRRAAGVQARLLNQLVDELLSEHHLSEKKLAELLGHTPLEVFAGAAVGIAVAVGLHTVWAV